MEHKPLRFIANQIEVEFDVPPILEKKPSCPDRFVWKNEVYQVKEQIGEWQDHSRRGSMAHNMRAENAAIAEVRGSWGVGRYYFRVRTLAGQVFDLYYDRAPKNADDRKGSWFLYREMVAVQE
jgi:Domain of unknown function (DUF6504)